VLSDWPLLVRALNHYGATHVMRGRPTVGVAVINAALAIARREHLVAADIMPLNNLTALQHYRDLRAARAAGEEGLASASRHGERTLGGWLACNLSFTLWFDGSWDEIEQLVEDCAAGTPTATFQENITLLAQALARTARGEAVEGAGLGASLDAEDVSYRAISELERGIAALSQGRVEEAADLAIQSADRFFGFVGIEDDYPLFWVPAVELALETGRRDEARRLLATVADAPQALVPPYLRAQLHRLRALVAIAEQDDAAAEPDLVQAIEGLRSYGAPFYTARAQLELAELLSRAGRSNEARPQAEAAHEVFTRLRATPWAERAAAVASLAAV
jgi:tetratricopeptide (TPR) repeat protein